MPYYNFFFLGIYTIRKSVTHKELPSPRLIGNMLLQNSVYHSTQQSNVINFAALIMGQNMAGDIGHREIYQTGNDLNN